MRYEEVLMTKVAWYYYFENTTQQRIAELLGISRARVIKLLERARASGIVQFKLRQEGLERMQTEKTLMQAYGLKDIFVVPVADGEIGSNENVAVAAAMYISDRLGENSFINVGYGDTQSRILNNLATMVEQPVSCVSLTGGVHHYLPDTRSSVFNAKLYLMPAPLLASSAEMAEAMREEASLLEVSRMVKHSSMTVVGIGAMHESATIVKSGILSKNDFLYLKMQGAVGDILSHFIDRDGVLVPNQIDSRLISTSLDTLRELENVIGVAAGEIKVDAIQAALRGGYLDVLITDEATATLLAERVEAEGK